MAITNRDRVQRALDAVREGLAPFVERSLRSRLGKDWAARLDANWPFALSRSRDGGVQWDSQAVLRAMSDNWQSVFRETLGHAERSWVSELREARNAFAHEKPFSSEDTYRALDTAQRLLASVGASSHAALMDSIRQELLRIISDQSARNRIKRRGAAEPKPQSGLRSWRQVIVPHEDVRSGNYQQAQFAADLAQVHAGTARSEYGDPEDFYRRTFLTTGIRSLLRSAMLRLSGTGGDPVIELQTNFGGGKTHSMLALYHLFGPVRANRLPGVEELMRDFGVEELPKGRRAALVGTNLSPSEPREKEDGTRTRTLWGEMAWQLGGPDGYGVVARSDEQGLSPGSERLVELFSKTAPCIVLIDEWVAFIRQLYRLPEPPPAGSFDANLTFVQSLTEAARAAPGAMVVASLPASQVEIGGEGGQQALERLRNTFGRMESPWLPATAEEGFEIVRRRLFEPLHAKSEYISRDAVIKAFIAMYAKGGREFPAGCGESAYRRRMEAAYPIHPELFDRLYDDWGGLDKFQRTRGVLRFMAAVIQALWEQGDPGLLILPSFVPLDDGAVRPEILKYLEGNWSAVIGKDVDGSHATSAQVDRESPRFGKLFATRRVARSVFVGSAPAATGRNRGIDDRQIRLGCAQPGESVSAYGDALRRLSDRATYLYQDGSRHWFATRPSVARLADDRAAAIERAEVDAELVQRLRHQKGRGEFERVHIAPESPADVPDETDAGLVILGPAFPHAAKGEPDLAVPRALEFLESRGSGPRVHRNALLFLAADSRRMEVVRDGVRFLMAWRSICDDADLELEPAQKRQAEAKRAEFETAVDGRIAQAWVVALEPTEAGPGAPVEWAETRLSGDEPSLAVRMSKAMVREERLISTLGPLRLRMAMEEGRLWRDADHLDTKQLLQDLASYLYLPRLKNRKVLAEGMVRGAAELTCPNFAYADGFDEEKGEYLGLRVGQAGAAVEIGSLSVVVRPEAAFAQRARETPRGADPSEVQQPDAPDAPDTADPEAELESPKVRRRFYGSVELNAVRAARDFGKVAEEVLDHLTTLPKARVTVTVEIQAEVPGGAPETVRRVVEENCGTLKFRDHGFETD